MKQLTQYIQEKLQINKDSKVKNSLLENIYSFLFNDDGDGSFDEERKVIKRWIDINKVKNVKIFSTKEVFEKYGYSEEDSDIKIEDVIKDYKDKEHITIQLISDMIYEKLLDKSDNNVLVYTNKYENFKIFERTSNLLILEFQRGSQIFLLNDDDDLGL